MKVNKPAQSVWRMLVGRASSGVLAMLVMGVWLQPATSTADLASGEWWIRSDTVVKRYDTNGVFLGDFASASGFSGNAGVASGPGNDLYAAGQFDDTVKRWDGDTTALIGDFVASTPSPMGITFGPDGDLYVSSVGGADVRRFNGLTGAFISTFVASGSGGLALPFGLTFGPGGDLYVAGAGNNLVKRYDGTTGAYEGNFAASNLNFPTDLVFGPDGNLYVASYSDHAIQRFNGITGAYIDAFVSVGSGGLSEPYGLRFGPDGNLYVASYATDSIKRYNGVTGAYLGDFITGASTFNPSFLTFAVPEPSTALLLGVGGLLVWRRKRNGVMK